MNGVTLYEGPSVLTDDPIVAIATFVTKNRKTGWMIQTWIMHHDIPPVEASKTGADEAVCGQCPLRHYLNGACYVVIGQAPSSIWRAFHRGAYPPFDPRVHARYLAGRSVRLGAYGDPAAVPYEVWASVIDLAQAHTGYTHQVAHPRFDRRIADLCMVSADTPQAAQRLWARGFSTYRIRLPEEPVLLGETECLNETERTTCDACRLCSGIGSGNICVSVHGSMSRRFRTAA